MTNPISVPRDTQVFLGAPAEPMDVNESAAIARAVEGIDSVSEAHLPQAFVEGVVDPPTQILVVVVEREDQIDTALAETDRAIKSILPADRHLDVLPLLPDNDLLPTVRGADCVIKLAAQQSKKFWRRRG